MHLFIYLLTNTLIYSSDHNWLFSIEGWGRRVLPCLWGNCFGPGMFKSMSQRIKTHGNREFSCFFRTGYLILTYCKPIYDILVGRTSPKVIASRRDHPKSNKYVWKIITICPDWLNLIVMITSHIHERPMTNPWLSFFCRFSQWVRCHFRACVYRPFLIDWIPMFDG